jgi:hypothetical protein
VLLVDHVVARLELERVDLLLAPARHPPLVTRAGRPLTHQVVGAQHDQVHRLADEA